MKWEIKFAHIREANILRNAGERGRVNFLRGVGSRVEVLFFESNPRVGVILLSEYHASSIRPWRVILLRSDIRLMPSGIRFASLWANRISL